MKKTIVILLMFLSISISLCATAEKGTIDIHMDENLFVISFFSNESVYNHVILRVGSKSCSSEIPPYLILGSESSNEDMKSLTNLYRCKELFSDNNLYLIYDDKESSKNAYEDKIYFAYSTAVFFKNSISDSERKIIDNTAAKDVIRGILEANNVLIQIQKLDAETRKFSSVKLIDIPLDKIECSDALKKFEAFERIN